MRRTTMLLESTKAPPRRRLRAGTLTPLAALLAVALGAPSASAAATLTVDAPVSLDGVRTYSEVVVKAGGTLSVKARAADGSGGVLHLKAARIVVEPGGTIEANGSGYSGRNDTSGDGPGGGQSGAAPGDPGGGGAYGGHGGAATLACQPFALSSGTLYEGFPEPGSAGGAAAVAGGAAGSRGGHGGGVIRLEAAVIELGGLVQANGDDGQVVMGIGSGGGAGGAIELVANDLVVEGEGARLEARGGKGGGEGDARGGAGGGGRVVVRAPDPGAALAHDVSGGAGEECLGSPGDGGLGTYDAPGAPATCLDADGDGATASACGGDDCDDGDAAIHAGAIEACDGVDNDCSGAADDDLPTTACSAPLVCVGGACAEPADAGATTGSGADLAPIGVEYQGGCSVRVVEADDDALACGAAAAAILGGLAARGLRRRRR
jgi:hypothetical protein